MSETGELEQPRARKSYAKPVVKRVHLKPEEAVLGNCKNSGGTGPKVACGPGNSCKAQGS